MTERYHGLDAMRAVMMLLGLVLHSMASYTTAPIGDAWPFNIVAYLTWALVLASFGLFVYHAHRERPSLRFLSAWIKFPIVLGVTTVVCVGTYRALVRGTWIGELLNGRRYGSRTARYLGAM